MSIDVVSVRDSYPQVSELLDELADYGWLLSVSFVQTYMLSEHIESEREVIIARHHSRLAYAFILQVNDSIDLSLPLNLVSVVESLFDSVISTTDISCRIRLNLYNLLMNDVRNYHRPGTPGARMNFRAVLAHAQRCLAAITSLESYRINPSVTGKLAEESWASVRAHVVQLIRNSIPEHRRDACLRFVKTRAWNYLLDNPNKYNDLESATKLTLNISISLIVLFDEGSMPAS